MLTIGITGGIGSGKSTVARILSEDYNARLILADETARNVMLPGTPAYREIIEHFGPGILDEEQKIDRKKLGDIVFNDHQELLFLNRTTHGRVADKIKELLDGFREEGAKMAVVEAIVPVRHGFLDAVDTVWVVLASEPVRVERIMKRNGFSAEEALQRIHSQMSDEEYKSIANKIIYNDGTVSELKAKIRGLINEENRPS